MYSQDSQYTQYCGDARSVLPELPEHSVDCIITSPSYFGLRSYRAPESVWDDGWCGILGSEPTVQLYIQHLVGIFELCKRVLKPTGSLFINLDDSFAGGQPHKAGESNPGKEYYTKDTNSFGSLDKSNIGIPAKSLCAVPERFVVAMIDHQWILRNKLVWHKPSCMPESAKDRFTIDWEPFYFFTLQRKYFFERQFEPAHDWGTRDRSNFRDGTQDPLLKHHGFADCNFANRGRNARSVWRINPEPQPASKKKGEIRHYAAFPTALCTTPILACVPEQICTMCGKPRVRIYESSGGSTGRGWHDHQDDSEMGMLQPHDVPNDYEVKEIGLSDCGCGEPFKSGVVADIFSGTGTVAVEARKLGRQALLIDCSEAYCRIAQKRLEGIALPLEG